MRRFHLPSQLNAIRIKLPIAMMIFLIPLFGLFLYMNSYGLSIMRSEIASTNRTVLDLYMQQTDSSLLSMSQSLADLTYNNSDLSEIDSASDISQSAMALVNLQHTMNDISAQNLGIDAMFMYSPKDKNYVEVTNKLISFIDTGNISAYLKKTLSSTASFQGSDYSWRYVAINNGYCLFNIIRCGSLYIGAWVDVSHLPTPYNNSDSSNISMAMFTSNDGKPLNNYSFIKQHDIRFQSNDSTYYLTGSDMRYLIVSSPSTQGDFSIVSLTPDKKISSAFPYINQLMIFIVLSTLIILLLFLIFIERVLFVPMKRITVAMKEVGKGKLDVHIEPSHASTEFQLMNSTFNNMVSQIRELKIDIYEDKLARDNLELERLELQVKPHFYLNSLSIIYTLAKSKNYDLLMEMSMHLITYFRYMFASDTKFVRLDSELMHVKNYLHIQQLRFPDKLNFSITAPDFLLDSSIPPLVIYSIVENSIKHSMTLDDILTISIKVQYYVNEKEDGMTITIADSGCGFSEEILDKLRLDKKITDASGEHIGLTNIKKRLMLIYNGRAAINCKNGCERGAVVDITLPIEQPKLKIQNGNT
jgi:two-component system, sensor histidine kinase YesM